MRRAARLARVARDCFLALLIVAPAASAQESQPQQPQIDWTPGPTVASLGPNAEITVPEGFLFTDQRGTRKLLELTHNVVGGTEVGAIVPAGDGEEDQWFVVFEFREIGYVKDDEKDTINPDALLSSLREGTESANEQRKKKGWNTLELVGWEKSPYYEAQSHNLTWAIRGRSTSSEGEHLSVNHSVRMLGRRGTMDADLVMGPEQYANSVPRFEALMNGFRFKEGHRYADFVKGDQVAAYGLTALIAGGAGAVAIKTGLFAQFWKGIIALLLVLKKAVIVLVLGLFAFIRKLFMGMKNAVARKDEEIRAPDAAAARASASRSDSGSGPAVS